MEPGSVYSLLNFYGSKNKPVYRVADHSVTVSFSRDSVMWVLKDSPVPFDEHRFWFHSYADFEANCDLKGDHYGTTRLKYVMKSHQEVKELREISEDYRQLYWFKNKLTKQNKHAKELEDLWEF